MTIRDRARGWLDQGPHSVVRELLLHACARHHLQCPAYCLMPDHLHLLWVGMTESSDQRLAAKFFRKHWNADLAKHGIKLQPQAHDHVLRKDERDPDAFEDTVIYIFKNPERAGLADTWSDWPYSGTILPGYPEYPPEHLVEFWPWFWKIHHRERSKARDPM